MKKKSTQDIHRVTLLITLAAVVFYFFFQINKGGPFRAINPFAEDPYDAVGSLAIQVALLVGVLTYARALRLQYDPAQATKVRLILRGDTVVLFAIWVTLIADAIAVVVHPVSLSDWGTVLLMELALMFLFASICTVMLAILSRRIPGLPVPRNLTPADGIDDLWALVRIPVTKLHAVLPHVLVEWVNGFNSDQLFAKVPWLHPRRHPWRFACMLGLLVGVGLFGAQLREGLPPNVLIGLVVAGIFITVEFGATLVGFAVFGGYLGLRPSLSRGT